MGGPKPAYVGKLQIVAALLTAALLAGCDSGSSPGVPTPPPPAGSLSVEDIQELPEGITLGEVEERFGPWTLDWGMFNYYYPAKEGGYYYLLLWPTVELPLRVQPLPLTDYRDAVLVAVVKTDNYPTYGVTTYVWPPSVKGKVFGGFFREDMDVRSED